MLVWCQRPRLQDFNFRLLGWGMLTVIIAPVLLWQKRHEKTRPRDGGDCTPCFWWWGSRGELIIPVVCISLQLLRKLSSQREIAALLISNQRAQMISHVQRKAQLHIIHSTYIVYRLYRWYEMDMNQFRTQISMVMKSYLCACDHWTLPTCLVWHCLTIPVRHVQAFVQRIKRELGS